MDSHGNDSKRLPSMGLVQKDKKIPPWETKENLAIFPIVLAIRPHPAPGCISLTKRGGEDKPCVVSVLEVVLSGSSIFPDSAFHLIVQLTCFRT